MEANTNTCLVLSAETSSPVTVVVHAVSLLFRDQGVWGGGGRVGREARRARGAWHDLAAGAGAQHAHADLGHVQDIEAALLQDLGEGRKEEEGTTNRRSP